MTMLMQRRAMDFAVGTGLIENKFRRESLREEGVGRRRVDGEFGLARRLLDQFAVLL